MTADQNVPSGVEVAMLLRRAQLRKQMACEAALAQVGMTLPQWGILLAVVAEPDSSTHALALFTGQSDQSAGAVVARLEQRGLLARRPGVGKAILHRITPDGDELVRHCNAIVEDVMAPLIVGLSDRSLRSLRTSLQSIAEAALPTPTRSDAVGLSGLSGGRDADGILS
ncbi:MarR family winged helix-turn-helix transcriptional regulator [Nocardia sp. CA2R105]|uniref:MarR family winged helix-turn-helix transcriptional regulator n=1 Tax=Nocardia coffeae TaxID=2873381 RepID=UPI001CA6D827|nr:MarR family winged helix-turn-helix transcriptional regulator [Nocardia coffeae]MBY8860669.1 MarR family winged helix-turn-helix transcriptional regulator [Nocardia coffeae]